MSTSSPNTTKYYDRYWRGQIKGGAMDQPGLWTIKNLSWHYQFFNQYLGKDILDIGCGDGVFTSFIKNQCPSSHLTGIDQSRLAIHRATKTYPNISFHPLDIENISNLKQQFNTVFAIEVLEHLLDIDLCLDQIYRSLKPKGFFCITTTDFNLPKKIIIALLYWNKYFYPNNPHIRFFTRQTLADICLHHRLKLVDYRWNHSYLGLMPQGQMAVFQRI